jgi:DNA processing protein
MLGVSVAGPLGPARTSAPDNARRSRPFDEADALDREAWAVLASVSGIGPATLTHLVAQIGSPRTVLDLARRDRGRGLQEAARHAAPLGTQPLLTLEVAEAVADRAAAPEPVLEPLRRLGLRVVVLGDADYPSRLLAIEMPPPVLFVRGTTAALESAHAVGVVGTRTPTDAGRALAIRLTTAVAVAGATIVSGLAVGVDGAAHAAAIDLRLPTVAVLGSGHDRLYPRAHRALADAIVADGGAVVSELAPNEEPTRWSFPRRNRVISGLADAIVVVEAPQRSGALLTAGFALEQGRGCFIVPGRIGDRGTAGSLEFLRQFTAQARVVASIEGLVEDLGLAGVREKRRGRGGPLRLDALGLSTVETRLAERLQTSSATVDELVHVTELPVATILGALTLLETRGLVTSAYGRYRPSIALAGAMKRRRGEASHGRPSARP